MKKVWVLMGCTIFLLCGCTLLYGCSAQEKQVPEQNPPKSAVTSVITPDFVTMGMRLMQYDRIGVLHYGLTETAVVGYLGNPTKKGKPKIWSADGLYHWDYTYSKLGVKLNFAGKKKMAGTVVAITVSPGTFQGSTLRNIHLGSTKENVLGLYMGEINPVQKDKNAILAGTKEGGIIFRFNNKGIINQIFIGASAE